jgi:hypothetical protein
MAFQRITEKTTDSLSESLPRKPLRDDYSPGPPGLVERLKDELPGHDETYYTDMAERIMLTAVTGSYNLQSVIDSFIVGAENLGEGVKRNANQ